MYLCMIWLYAQHSYTNEWKIGMNETNVYMYIYSMYVHEMELNLRI